MLNIFLVTFLNTSLLHPFFFVRNDGSRPYLLSKQWFRVYSDRVVKAVVFTNIIYYLIALVKVVKHQLKLCCQRQKQKKGLLGRRDEERLSTARVNRTTSQFSFERRYA
jgi:hypothetical protein